MKYTLLKYKKALLGQIVVPPVSNSCFYDDTQKYAQLYFEKPLENGKEVYSTNNSKGYYSPILKRKMLQK